MGILIYFLFGVLLQRVGVFWLGYSSFEAAVLSALVIIRVLLFDILVTLLGSSTHNDRKPPLP